MTHTRTTQRILLAKLAEEAIEQPNPTEGLRKAAQDYYDYQATQALRVKTLASARHRKHRAQKPDPYLFAMSRTRERQEQRRIDFT